MSLAQAATSLAIEDSKFHEHFNDADADLIIISSDGVKFRVFKKQMRKASKVFDHMLGDEHSIVTDIPLDDDAETLEIFLWLVYLPEGRRTWDFVIDIRFETAQKFVNTCSKYDATALIEKVCTSAQYVTLHQEEAGKAFALGCEFRNAGLCSKAMLAMDWSQYPQMDPWLLERISKEDLHAFHCAVWESKPRRQFPKKPSRIVKKFKLP